MEEELCSLTDLLMVRVSNPMFTLSWVKKYRNRENPSIAVPSGGIQSMLEKADADALLLPGCCHSAAVPTTDYQQRTGGVLEVIAACRYETIVAEVV
jgi:hypothetical protein